MRQTFYIESYDWRVTVWYLDGEPESAVGGALRDLRRAGCAGESLGRASRLLTSGKPNTGVTYSNPARRESVMVVGRSRNATECANTMIHERCHLQAQICEMCGIDPLSESAAYLAGDIGGKMYAFAHVLLCEGCRNSNPCQVE